MNSEVDRLKEALNLLTDMYKEPGLLLINYRVRKRLRAILGPDLSSQTLDRNPVKRTLLSEV